MSSGILFRTASDAADAVRRREVSSRELTEAMLTRISEGNPQLNAVVELRAEQALSEAAAADQAAARRPLHGVPITVKEALNVIGMHTTWGNPAFRDYVADWDATVVARLKHAGAIIAGKSNAHFMLADFGQTSNQVYGRTNNPWDLTRTPGGSSGGGAAAVAAGMTFLDYGSDLVGSIRIPASFCGVYGIKPSAGIVSVTGLQPPGPPAPSSEMLYMSNVGPLARSARDLRAALGVTGGPDAAALEYRLPPSRRRRLTDFRVGFVLEDVASDVGGALSDAVDGLAAAGIAIKQGWPDGINPRAEAEAFAYHIELFFALAQPGGSFERLPELIAYEHRRMASRAAWGRYFDAFDVFLCPVNFTAAFPHDDRPFHERTIQTEAGERPYTDQPFWIAQPSLPGLPAVSAPIGQTATGLPVGAQVIGPLYEDDTAITFAELMADVVGGYQPPPF